MAHTAEQRRAYTARNRKRINAYAKKYYHDNQEHLSAAERVRRKLRAWVQRMQIIETLGGCCANCGYKEHLDGLEIDHVVPIRVASSDRILTKIGSIGWNKIEEALVGCQLLCGTCHRIKTRADARATGGWKVA